jgi:hypothetical protein
MPFCLMIFRPNNLTPEDKETHREGEETKIIILQPFVGPWPLLQLLSSVQGR